MNSVITATLGKEFQPLPTESGPSSLTTRYPVNSLRDATIIQEWIGVAPLDAIQISRVDSSLHLSQEARSIMDDLWNGDIERGLKRFDGAQCRFEGVLVDPSDDKLIFQVSPISYRIHNYGRFETFYNEYGLPIPASHREYPNPLSIIAVQVTTDGKILIGEKNTVVSDQYAQGLVGAGFLGRTRTSSETQWAPGDVVIRLRAELDGETSYNSETPYTTDDARVISVTHGDNHDTGIGIFQPLKVSSDHVSLGNDEHRALILVPDDRDSILELVNRRVEGNKPLVATVYSGILEAYLRAKEEGLIVHPYRI